MLPRIGIKVVQTAQVLAGVMWKFKNKKKKFYQKKQKKKRNYSATLEERLLSTKLDLYRFSSAT